MVLEHTAKIGIILGPNLQFSSKENYKKDIYKKLKFDKKLLRLKKTSLIKKGYKSQYIIIIATLAE